MKILNRQGIVLFIMALLCPFFMLAEVRVGAAKTEEYVPLLKGKRIALLSNHTGIVGDKHTLDLMLEKGLNVTTIFSPEHGFRGTADAGEHVNSGKDEKTGIKIASMYDGKTRMPSVSTMDGFDVIVCDLQDVGLRFYTYYCTMLDLMKAAAAHGKEFVVLDRPNPNGMTVDGPILDMAFESGIGRLPIPVVYGMTMGELAQMAKGEGWLEGAEKLKLKVIACDGYNHRTRYELPVAPSPNLGSMKAVYLYPSTCFFEGTVMSLGRGTDRAFTIYGHPDMKGMNFSFTPKSRSGAKNPPHQDKKCYGRDLNGLDDEEIIAGGLNLEYVIDAYRRMGMGEKFFNRSFNLLAGTDRIKKMILAGKSADEIKVTWQDDVEKFKKQRKKYLIYDE